MNKVYVCTVSTDISELLFLRTFVSVLMEKLWNSQGKSDAKDNLRPLHGRLFLVPNKEDISYDVRTSSGEKSIQVKIMGDTSQQVLANAALSSQTSMGNQQFNAKVSRSQSFCENGIKMDYLMAPDPRRFSFASNESEISSASSMSDIWNSEPSDVKKNFSPLYKTPEFSQRDSIWGDSEFNFGSDKCHSIKEHSGYDNDYFHQLNSSIRESTSFLRRSSGFSSDSEKNSRRPSTNFDRRYSRFSVDSSRRDSELSSLSDRRSSGFVSDFDRRSSGFASDFDRRDSSSSNSSISHFSGHVEPQQLVHTPVVVHPGMEHVPLWLKSLRLHKYTDLVMSMTYDEMTGLTEEKLEHLSVTKGARRKIVASIQKLLERPTFLATIDRDLDHEDCDVKKVLMELESVIKSPIKIEEEENLRRRHDSARDSGAEVSEDEEQESGVTIQCDGQKLVEMILNTLRKACSLILLSQHTDTKNVALLTTLLDLCLPRDCYLPRQKQLLSSWKQKLYSIWGPLPSPHQTVNHKDKPFQLKTQPAISSNSFQSGYGQHAGLPNNWAGWAQHLDQDNVDRLTVPPLGENFQQSKIHPFLMQRKSAPNIESFNSFSSPVSYKKRYSFQDGDVNPHTSLQHRYSLPTIDPQLPRSIMKNEHGPPLLTRLDSDWRSNLNISGLRFSDFSTKPELSSDTFGIASEQPSSFNNITREKSPPGVESPSDTELNSRMECLCLAVTKQALD